MKLTFINRVFHLFILLTVPLISRGSELISFSPVTNRIIMLHFSDGYVDHYGLGETKSDDITWNFPLNVSEASLPENFSISSLNDEDYSDGLAPVSIGRKSKGKDFSGNAGEGFPIVREHYIFLKLPHALKEEKEYRLIINLESQDTKTLEFIFNSYSLHSETIHVNQHGYASNAPVKLAYLSNWMGDMGPLDLQIYEDTDFQIIKTDDNSVLYSGKIEKRKDLETGGPDGNGEKETPYGSFTGADVWVCDFSDFHKEGEYKIVIEGIGCSYTFEVGSDALRKAFKEVTRALYHQRCGTKLENTFTEWTRDRCHHPAETDTVILSSWRYMDKRNAFVELPQYSTGIKRPLWGGWHDAADWDKRTEHLEGTRYLLFAYDLKPDNFIDNELNIPESGNGIPDILDEAMWNIDFFYRSQNHEGGIHGGIETTGHPSAGVGSVEDKDQWYAYALDPVVSYSYAGTAGYLYICLEKAGLEEESQKYLESAIKAYEWALINTSVEDENNIDVRDQRHFAAAVLYRITGEEYYQQQFLEDNLIIYPNSKLYQWQKLNQSWGSYMYALSEWDNQSYQDREIIKNAILSWADFNLIDPAKKRSYRFGSDFNAPTGWGNATTPNFVEVAMAWVISGDPSYLSWGYTNCDYVLGANPLNMCWVSGLGNNYPQQIMHLDSRYYHPDKGQVPGLIPFGPAVYTSDAPTGHWQEGHAYKSAYPDPSLWPSHEMYFENQYCAKTNEFTVHRPLLPAAAAFGFFSNPYNNNISSHIINGVRQPDYYQENLEYSVQPLPGASYKWTFPESVEVIEGADSSTVKINWGCESGLVNLEITYKGVSYNLEQKVELKRFRISGPEKVQKSSTGIEYSVVLPDSFLVNWSSSGGIYISSNTSNTIISTDIEEGGMLYLEIINACGSVFDSLKITVQDEQKPYPDENTPHPIPGIIKSAWYDLGGEGIAYHDNDPENNGPGIRQEESVDTEEKDGSQTIGWVVSGEWLEYSINVQEPDYYHINTRVASPGEEGKFIFSLDDRVITDTLYSINTGSWADYTDVTTDSVFLESGTGILKLIIIEGGFNIGDIVFSVEQKVPDMLSQYPSLSLSLFPLPADQILNVSHNIHSHGELFYSIINLSGQVVISGAIVELQEAINIKKLTPGCYIFEVIYPGGSANRLIIKK